MIEMYLNGEPLGFLPSTHFEQALAYAHTLCKLEGKGAHYSYAKIGGRESTRVFPWPVKPPENVDTIGEPGVGPGLPWFYARHVC